MNTSVETILLYTIAAGFLSIVYGFFTGKSILSLSPGNVKMQEIASAIQIGAKAYLARQYKTIAVVGVVVLVIICWVFSPLVGLGYFIGAALSGIAGYVGMLVSVQANVRTAEASRKGLASGLAVAFKSGAVTGMLVAGLALLAIAVYYFILLRMSSRNFEARLEDGTITLEDVRIIHESDRVPPPPLAYSTLIPEEDRKKIKKAVLDAHNHGEISGYGGKMSHYMEVKDSDYNVLREVIELLNKNKS